MSDSPDEMPDGTEAKDPQTAQPGESPVRTAVLDPVVPTEDEAGEEALEPAGETAGTPETETSAAELPEAEAHGNGSNGNGSNGNGSNGNGSNGNGASVADTKVLTPGRSDTAVLPVLASAPIPPPPPWAPDQGAEAATAEKSHRLRTALLVAGGVVLVLVAAVLVFDWTQSNNVLPGVAVDGVDVGGLSRDDAGDLLGEKASVALDQVVVGRADGESHPVTLADLGVSADVEGAVDNAVAARSADADAPEGFRIEVVTGPFTRTYHRLLNKPVDVDVEMAYTVDPAARDAWVNGVKAKMDRAPVDARIDVSTGAFQVVPSLVGRQLDPAALTTAIDGNARKWALESYGEEKASEDVAFDLPVAIIPPAVTEQNIGISIFVNRSERKLYHYDGATLVGTYTVAVGSPGHPTPKGEFEIVDKRKNPTWVNPAPSGWGAGMPASIPPGPSNPLGVRALNLNASGIRIHGTNNVGSLGSAASHGCIRMANSQIVDFFELIPVGTRVVII